MCAFTNLVHAVLLCPTLGETCRAMVALGNGAVLPARRTPEREAAGWWGWGRGAGGGARRARPCVLGCQSP